MAEEQSASQSMVAAAEVSGAPFEMKVLTPELLLSFLRDLKTDHLGPVTATAFLLTNVGNFRALRLALMGKTAIDERPDQLFYIAMTPELVKAMTDVMGAWVR